MADVQTLLTKVEESLNVFETLTEKQDEYDGSIRDLTQKILGLAEEVNDFKLNGNAHMEKNGEKFTWTNPKSAKGFCDFMQGVVTDNVKMIKEASIIGKATAGMNETTAADGGYTVPPEYNYTILRLIDVFGQVPAYCTRMPMSRRDLKITTLDSSVSVYWVDEGADFTISKPAFAQFTMQAKKLCALVPYTAELAADSFIAIATFISTIVAEQYAREIDRVILLGDVTGASDPFDGVFVDSDITRTYMASGSTLFEDLDADELLDMTQNQSNAAKMGSAYWMHPTIFDICRKLKDTAGNYIVQHPTVSGPSTMWGYPVIQHELLPAITDQADSTLGVGPFVMFGNMKYFYIGDREDLSVQRSNELYFISDQVAWRWKRRMALQVALAEAFVLLLPATV